MMRIRITGLLSLTVVLICGVWVQAGKELMYDPEKGIIFVDEKDVPSTAKQEHEKTSESKRTPVVKSRKKSSSDIHIGRKKDPPELYYRSGLEYYKNGDFNNALKNFSFADSVDPRPEYRLWIGKTLRSLGRVNDMLRMMFDIIKKDHDSDVADDALFELAVFYKMEGDYEKANQLFTRLIEQYPFGLSFSTGEELREIAREQRRLMRAEMINILTTLGYIGEDLPSSYRKFQKANKLPLTECGDQETVQAIKKQHRLYMEKEENRTVQQEKFNRYRVWIYIAMAAGGVNALLLLLLFSMVKSRKRYVADLQQIVTDLDVKKL